MKARIGEHGSIRVEDAKSRTRWHELAYYDARGIDADIERAVTMLQKQRGCPREHARGELLRKLASAVSA